MLKWYGAGAVAAIFVAWIASLVHASGHAPVGLVSLVVGVSLGVVLAKFAAALRVDGVRRLVIGAVLLAFLAVLAEHAWLYLDFRRQWREAREKSPQVAMFRAEEPLSPLEYFSNEATPGSAVLWGVDAAIIVGSGVGAVYLLKRSSQ